MFAEGCLTEAFDLTTGLSQGCCVAPLLFNIFFGAVMEKWRMLEGRRLDWSTRVDGVLHRVQLDKYATHTTCSLSELGYADDLGLLGDCYGMLKRLTQEFQVYVAEWGLTLSVEKTEAMCTTQAKQPPIPVMPQQKTRTKLPLLTRLSISGAKLSFMVTALRIYCIGSNRPGKRFGN